MRFLLFLTLCARALANTATLPANALTNRATNDGAAGSIFVEKTGLTSVAGCRLSKWSFFDDDGAGRMITPLLLEQTGATWTIRGIGATITSTGAGVQANLNFGLVSGTDIVGNANFRFGWKDGGNGSDNQGVADFTDSGSPGVDWLGAGRTTFAAGNALPVTLSLARIYSLQGHFVAPGPPQFTQHPQSVSVYAGQSVTFTVSAGGDGTITWQWRKGVADISGQTASTLTLSSATAADTGSYTCMATSAFGSTPSNAATLTILTPPAVAPGGIDISEFLADNAGGLTDADGASPDWIEIHNANAFPVNLDGWRLTDVPGQNNKWVFPLTVLPAGGYKVVFASSKDRGPVEGELHTNFKLDPDGEYLALVKPDGTVAQEFAPQFPDQKTNISYGTALHRDDFPFVPTGVSLRWLVPSDGSLGDTWKNASFTDNSWTSGPGCLGFDTIGTPAGPPVETAGNAIINRTLYDTASGSIFVLETNGFTQSGTVTEWSFFSNTALNITPLILHRDVSGNFTTKGIGTTRLSNGGGAQSFAFGVVSGSAQVSTGDYLAWKDGGQGTNVTGVPVWTDGLAGTTVRWFGQQTGFAVNGNLGAGQAFTRTYSISAAVRASLGAYVATSMQSAMLNTNASLYVRAPFTLPTVPVMDRLTLRVRCEDGFTAWLNGTEVASVNAPAALAFNSAAPSDRSRDAAAVVEEMDLTPHLGLLTPGANVLALHAMNDTAASGDFLICAELSGRKITPLPGRFMLTTTPGAPNADGILGFVSDTTFTPKRGFCTAPQTLRVTTLTPGALIRYTTDGSLPTLTSGSDFPAGGLPITSTTIVRAAAFLDGYAPTNVDTHTYLYAAGTQAQTGAGFPATWAGATADYEVDPNVTLPASALTTIPSVSVVTHRDDLFGGSGIYSNSGNRGDAWERAASIEFLNPDNTPGFQADAGISIAGDSSRGHGFTPKHHLLVSFKQQYGPSKLHYPLFPDTPENDFDILELRACSTDSWPVVNGYVDNGLLRWETTRATYLRDQFLRDTMRDMGEPTSHGRYVHLWINGLYWGLYDVCERMGSGWASEYFGGPKDEWDVMKDYAEVEDGTITAWNDLIAFCGAGFPSNATGNARYFQLQGLNPDGSRNPAFPVHLHMDTFIDYMAAHIYAGSEDWPGHNWWASRRRTAESEGWRFHVWDQEISSISLVRTQVISGFGLYRFEEVATGNCPAFIYDRLRQNGLFRDRFTRRLECLCFGSGPLTPLQNAARWGKRQSEIDQAIIGESARWGDVRREPPFTRNDWFTEMAWQANYWPAVHPIAAARFQRVNLWPGDTDGDFMPDTWETRIFGNLTATPDADADGDGFTTCRNSPTAPTRAAPRAS